MSNWNSLEEDLERLASLQPGWNAEEENADFPGEQMSLETKKNVSTLIALLKEQKEEVPVIMMDAYAGIVTLVWDRKLMVSFIKEYDIISVREFMEVPNQQRKKYASTEEGVLDKVFKNVLFSLEKCRVENKMC